MVTTRRWLREGLIIGVILAPLYYAFTDKPLIGSMLSLLVGTFTLFNRRHARLPKHFGKFIFAVIGIITVLIIIYAMHQKIFGYLGYVTGWLWLDQLP